MRSQTYAFTLLELAMALAAAAIIAAFALPMWHGQIARSHRIDAIAALYRAAQFVDMQAPAVAALPAGMDQAPPTGVPVYRLKVLPADESNGGYAIAASPVESGPMAGDVCGTFTLDATGARANETAATVDKEKDRQTEECWRGR